MTKPLLEAVREIKERRDEISEGAFSYRVLNDVLKTICAAIRETREGLNGVKCHTHGSEDWNGAVIIIQDYHLPTDAELAEVMEGIE